LKPTASEKKPAKRASVWLSRRFPIGGKSAESARAQYIGEQRGDGYVFRDRKSLPRELQRWVNRACQQLGLGHSRVHDFRAGYAQALFERLRTAGATDRQARREVAAALGHGWAEALRHYLAGKVHP
jgi:integrase